MNLIAIKEATLSVKTGGAVATYSILQPIISFFDLISPLLQFLAAVLGIVLTTVLIYSHVQQIIHRNLDREAKLEEKAKKHKR